jgi:hypothetical protein
MEMMKRSKEFKTSVMTISCDVVGYCFIVILSYCC